MIAHRSVRVAFKPAGSVWVAAPPVGVVRASLPVPARGGSLLAGAPLLVGALLAGLVLAACTPAADETRQVAASEPAVAQALAFADSVLAAAVAEEVLPGAVLLVARDGAVLHERAYGYAGLFEGDRRLVSPEPMTVGHVFDLASVTKVMATTWAMMLLVDRGLVELDNPVHTYLPDFRGPEKDRITVRDLLTHRSGLYRWKPVYYHAGSQAEAYSYIRDLPLESGVGEWRRYSDLGFMLAGYIVETVGGRCLDVFLNEELYGPLGLTHTGFVPGRRGNGWPGPAVSGEEARRQIPAEALVGILGSRRGRLAGPFVATSHGNPYEKRMVEDDSFGYLCDEDPTTFTGWRSYNLQGEVNDGNAWHAHRGVAGHAGLFSTGSDLGVLLGILLEDGTHDGRPVVSAGVVREFLAPDILTGNGVGWAMSRMGLGGGAGEGTRGVQVFSHSGFTGTYLMGVPELGLAVVFLSNRQNVGLDGAGYYPDAARIYLPLVQRIVEAVAEGR